MADKNENSKTSRKVGDEKLAKIVGNPKSVISHIDQAFFLRVNDSYYLQGVQLEPSEMLAVINGNANEVTAVEKHALAMSREVFGQLVKNLENFKKELISQGLWNE